MSEKYIFAVLGGDRRQSIVAKKILMHGHSVRVFGLGNVASELVGAEICNSVEKCVECAHCILLPLPATRDGKNLNLQAENSDNTVALDKIIGLAHQNGNIPVLGGLIPEELYKKAKEIKIDMIDYYSSEKLQQLNALPSAEGAIAAAMGFSDKVLEGMPVLVCGYGRIGKILASKLRSLGAKVIVCVRREEVVCELVMSGYEAVRINEIKALKSAIKSSEIIFNTVPSQVFTRSVIDDCNHHPIYIEIASSPGGIDINAAREKGIALYFLPSLPGKYAPVSAGEYIFETLKELLCERGIVL